MRIWLDLKIRKNESGEVDVNLRGNATEDETREWLGIVLKNLGKMEEVK